MGHSAQLLHATLTLMRIETRAVHAGRHIDPATGAVTAPIHLSTTFEVYVVQDEAQVIRRVRQHLIERELRSQQPPPPVATGYDASDLAVLFGGS